MLELRLATPLVATAARSVTDPLNVDGGFGVDFLGTLDGFRLGRRHRAGTSGVGTPDGIVAFGPTFNEELVLHGFLL